jgi:LPS-assembly protein
MPRSSATMRSTCSFAFVALACAVWLSPRVSAQTPGGPPDTSPASASGLTLKLEPRLDETQRAQPLAPTFARARSIEGSVSERIVLRGDAEIRRGGTVLRGDTITYTQATDEVNVVGNARVYRDGGSFSGPRLDFRIDAQTGSMPDVNFSYLPRNGRGEASLVEFLGNEQARMLEARFTTCAPGDNAWWVQAESIEFDGLEESATASVAKLYFHGVPIRVACDGFPVGGGAPDFTPSFGLSST